METHIDWIGLSALVAGIAALVVAIYGVYDVRKHVKLLVTIDRNSAYTRILHRLVWEFVDPTDKALNREIAQAMQEFTLLARAVNPEMTLNDAQAEANHETLTYAQMLVDGGYGKWKTEMDPDRAKVQLHKWQADKNAVLLAKMFGKKRLSIF
jgi:hypothetical protein